MYVLHIDLRTNSDCLPIKHKLAGFYNRESVYCPVRTEFTFNI